MNRIFVIQSPYKQKARLRSITIASWGHVCGNQRNTMTSTRNIIAARRSWTPAEAFLCYSRIRCEILNMRGCLDSLKLKKTREKMFLGFYCNLKIYYS